MTIAYAPVSPDGEIVLILLRSTEHAVCKCAEELGLPLRNYKIMPISVEVIHD